MTFSEGKGSGGKVVGIGGFRSYDWFGDANFYLLDTPGHTIGHICIGEDDGDGFWEWGWE